MIRIESTVGARGQTVIPKPIRDQLKLQPGDKVWFRIEDGHIIIEREDAHAMVEAFISGCTKRPLPPDLDLDALYEEQYEERWKGRLPKRQDP